MLLEFLVAKTIKKGNFRKIITGHIKKIIIVGKPLFGNETSAEYGLVKNYFKISNFLEKSFSRYELTEIHYP